jgi:acyl-CoA thioesterase-1
MFTMTNDGRNAQEWQGKVGRHYRLPMISFRDALWPEIHAGRIKWEDVEADVVHPNDRGHAYMARFVTSLLERVLESLPEDAQLPARAPVAGPLFGDLFEHVCLLEADALKPVANHGWQYDAANRCWKSDTPGSTIEFAIEGQAVLAMDWHIRGPMGKAKIQVDYMPPAVQDGWFEQTWGGWRMTTELARGLPPGTHRVRVEILPDAHPQSTGHEFRILGLGAAGVDTRR